MCENCKDKVNTVPFDFSYALSLLKDGRPVARKGWNGKGMFIYMVPAASYEAMTPGMKLVFGEGKKVPYGAYIAIKNAQGTVNMWNPSQADLFAEDWVWLPWSTLEGTGKAGE